MIFRIQGIYRLQAIRIQSVQNSGYLDTGYLELV